jgi:hypothetical protein
MRFLTRSLPVLACLMLTACNFPTSRTAVIPTDTETVITTLRPAWTRTAESVPPTATQEPQPTSGPIAHLAAGTALAIASIDMIDDRNGWAVGGDAGALLQDHLFRTEDGGSTWRDVTPPEQTVVQPATDRIAVGAFWDSDNAWATFYSSNLLPPPTVPVVWRTTDGGDTWKPSAPLDLSGWVGEYRVSDLFFINIQTGWIMIHKGDDPAADTIALYQTVNGGNTWERVIDPAVKSDVQDCEKTGILFTGPWVGWLTGDCLGARAGVFLFQTYDGGKSWISAKLPSPATPPGMLTSTDFSCRIHPPIFFAQKTSLLLAVECTSKTTKNTAHYLYTNESSSWHLIPYPGGQMAIRSPGDGRVFRGDVQSGLAVSEELNAYNGVTGLWEKIGTIDWTGQFDFVDWNKGWAAARRGDAPLLMYTDDGGRTWEDLKPTVAAE